MAKKNPQVGDSAAIDEAIDWHVRLGASNADEETWMAFAQWLEADPANRQAYDRVEDVDAELDDPKLRGVLASAEYDSSPVSFDRFPATRRRISVFAWATSAALAIAAVLAVVLLPRMNAPMPIEFVTRIGETKIATLSDGTEIDINTDTRIMVSLDRGFRRVTLDYGEALFHVAKDPVRPFIVTVGDRTVRDVGTVFNIQHSNGVTTVTVAEGRVGVSPSFPANRHKEVVLLAGDQLVHADGTVTATVEHVDPAEALAWRRGYLVYRNAPLSKVASDLGRYFTVPIRLNDNRVAAQKFTGVLRLDSESAVLRRITILLPVTIEYGPDGKITLRMSD